MSKNTGLRELSRERDKKVVQMIREGASYDDICATTGIHRTRISLLARREGLLQRDRVFEQCSVDECVKPQHARGYCRMHNVRLKRYGTLELPPSSDYVRNWCRENNDRLAGYARKYRAENPRKRSAHRKVEVAIRTGRMTRKPCGMCGNVNSQAHHDDYSKPLDVIWLCPQHHKQRHKILTLQGIDPDAE